ncbi:hypothetical protein BXZ70DRAFT_986358 [Cristinia sonorae]|uniref:Mediator of RNA polymerase II transcription subunit 5 n=1 Tax=Cristinia sonorae TaxID=1940300 RepID=A0A8K0URG5_9AGAR|nr:hypothetical protein BXZ70DRAFT_986358 [Cristinia sonorae]
MSLSELTRNAFQSGISAGKWLKLSKLFISQNLSHAVPEAIHRELSNSVLVLHRSYPGDPALQAYLKASIQDGILPLTAFVTAFLEGARSPDLHNSYTLDSLCRVIIESHYASGMPPIGSVVPFTASTVDILETVQDAMVLLRTAHGLSSSNLNHLVASASELLMLLLSCVTDVSHISTAQALVHFADASELLQLRLSHEVRQSLETLVLSLSLLLGDDAKAAREAQMMHTLQLALGKGDVIGPNSDSDITSCGLLLHCLITRRGNAYGSGDAPHVTALLVAFLRWSSWSPAIFYTQLLLSAVYGLSNFESPTSSSEKISAPLWRAFVIGRLPHILSAFEKAVEHDGTEPDWRTAMHFAISSLLHRADLIHRCDAIHYGITDDTMTDVPRTSLFVIELLRQFVETGLIEQSFAASINPAQQNDMSRMQSECQEANADLETYFESKVAAETGLEETMAFLGRVWKDPSSHRVGAEIIRKRFISALSSLDIDQLGYICKILYLVEPALDILSLHVELEEMLAMGLGLVEDYDCETVGDPQTAVAHLGDVVLFLQYALARFHLSSMVFRLKGRELKADVLYSGTVTHRIDSRGEDAPTFNTWFKALFDSNSEGIEDTILRSTRPKILLHMAGTLFSHAIQQCTERKLDKEVMNNGFSYFLGPLLNWTLIGVVKVLLIEIQSSKRIPLYQEVLQTLLTSTSCPTPVLRLTASAILRVFPSKFVSSPGLTFDHTKIRRIALEALKLPTEDPPTALTLGTSDWIENPRRYLRNALSAARSGKACSLDVDQCLLYMAPTKFLQVVWAELAMAISMGDQLETPRRLATYILSHPPPLNSPPLLPIFLHVVLPSIITSLDQASPAEQSMAVELLVAVISSTLTSALHVEWALLSVCNDPKYVLGQPVSGMARRLGGDLRKNTLSQTSTVVAQRLASSQSFVTNFPTYMAEG